METFLKRLSVKEQSQLREQLLEEQLGLCALCHEPIEPGKAVLDHEHRSGQIRSVLHRGCNSMEGIIQNNLARNLITPTRLAKILSNLVEYQKQLKPILHSTHRTAEERLARTRKRAKARRARK
jgi:hypothetical protein